MNAKERSDFTQGSILKKMIPFMMPILGALVLQAAYGAVDLLVVGRFGTTAGLSAVSTGSQILNLVTFVITQLAMGITVLIARYIGEKHTSQIGELLGGATTVFTMIAVVLFVVMVFFAKPLAVLMQAPKEALMLATVYKGNIIKNLIMDCQSYAKYRPNETTGGIFVSWRRKEELPTGA